MASQKKKTIITSALPYANGPLHIGHLAGCLLPADIYSRFLKAKNGSENTLFICGTDEHGVPITLRAQKEGKTPQEVVDFYHQQIAESLSGMNIYFDQFTRTSGQVHHHTAKAFFKELNDKGVFIQQESKQYFDEKTQQFLADRYIIGECPNCGNEKAYGDQCEKCGKSLSPDDLINPKSALSGEKPSRKKTVNWYLPLDKIQEEFLNEYIESKKGIWKSSVYGQCKSWLNEGLQARAMTRDLSWGIPLPDDIKNSNGKVMYVWFDAPIGYISATRELFPEDWKNWWKNDDADLIHFIGKDNIVFHCIIFPAMLQQHGGYILPKDVPAMEFLNLEGEKISTSRNHAIWVHEYLKEMPNRVDELRYVLTSIMPETKDSDFTWKDFQAKVNNELVAIVGNFINRVIVLAHKFFDGKINTENVDEKGFETIKEAQNKFLECETHLKNYQFRNAQNCLTDIARLGNKYFAETEPWHLIKSDKNAVQSIITVTMKIARIYAMGAQYFMPTITQKILDQLNLKDDEDFNKVHQLNEASILFKKIEDSEIEFQMEKLNKKEEKLTLKEEIQFEDFSKIDLRTAIIKNAERIPKADKLLKLTLDLDVEERVVLSGIAEHFSPEDIIGKSVTLVANLAPRKMRGIVSQGMVLMAEDSEGKLYFVGSESSKGGLSIS